ncbi:GNAT family N-acetyltransferase [Flavobacterium sp. Fl-77]|uniref:GNAT family N-acetyltransferase n=1 Tax=Flavobacterium flavipigmentatum TaxID=2893884 RepID=A0AAJ2VYZ4_9FLAO|nr:MULTISPECIES: GNAT family N-acetyltransferase [unclassified Flavobacterium]MDX6183435.1 GNAT family N-acetyltransferase [Flavobacterium sp. Fl-33]MDX6186719.1 GNAT family N-acetyltransferase [Flavobacterium sp. Fl-77]UFH38513.1 GNAT family N-acetyltransferase [Flavobacterium sp. F-70]
MIIKEIKASDTWKIRHEVMWSNQPFEFVQLEEDNEGLHFGAFINEEVVTVVSCFIIADEMQFRKLATLESYQGQGMASRLLKYILQLAKDKGLKKVWCNARTNKKTFYTKFGLKDTQQRFTKAGQEFTIMEIVF